MNNESSIVLAGLLLATMLGLAVFTDLRSRRIPNSLILAGWALGLAAHSIVPAGNWLFDERLAGSTGPLGAFAGAAILLLAFMPFYLLRTMGAGDVKLMSVVGAFFGATTDAWSHLLGVSLTVLATGGALAIVRMLWSRSSAAVLENLRLMLYSYAGRASGGAAPTFDARTDSADRMPYAIAIAVGTFVYIIGKQTGWISLF